MGFLIFFAIFMMFISALNKALKVKPMAEEVLPADPVCPPHKWFYQEIKNELGEIVKWKMVCQVCGPLRPINGGRE